MIILSFFQATERKSNMYFLCNVGVLVKNSDMNLIFLGHQNIAGP